MTLDLSTPHPGVFQVLMDRPAQMNALDPGLLSGLARWIGDEDASVVILGSTSRDCFSAGVDLKLGDRERAEVSRGLYLLYRQMRTTNAILVAAAEGHAIGGGAQLLIASDLRVVGPQVSIRFMGPGHGLAVGAWRLPGLVGRGRAMDLMLSMRPVGAEEALSIGLVEEISVEPLVRALEIARHIVGLSPPAVAALKRIVAIPGEAEALVAEEEFNDQWNGAFPGRATQRD
jgi:enoyl-CoA hydratase/carnithine racemase